LLGETANERLEKLIEEDSPMDHGWLRWRWSCKLLSLQLFGERLAEAGRETVRRALHRLEYRWRRPRVVGPDKDSPEQSAEKRERLEGVRKMTEEEVASFFQDETKLETNPKVGFCWMRKGRQRRLKTPGTNRKVWISGALNFHTGRLHWVSGQSAGTASFSSSCSTISGGSTAATSNFTSPLITTQATSANGSRSTWRTRKDASISIPCPRGLLRAIRWSWCGGLCTRP
jgi:hypothetical protein